MGTYDDKIAQERKALDAKFESAAWILSELLMKGAEKACGVTLVRRVENGSRTIYLEAGDPRVSISIRHDWGKGRIYIGSGTLPLGTPKIQVNLGYDTRPALYRPSKDGSFNVEKIVQKIAEAVGNYKLSQKARQDFESKEAKNQSAKKRELANFRFPDWAIVNRDANTGQYSLKFGGQFGGLSAHDVAILSQELEKLAVRYNFVKAWRSDF